MGTDESRDLDMRRFIYTYYGTTARSVLTIFQITMAPGAWISVGRPLIEEVSPAFAWFFVIYVGGVCFVVIRIITSLFLRQVLQVAICDEQMMRNEKVQKQRMHSESIRHLYAAADATGMGRLSFDQFEELLMDARIQTWLSALELDGETAANIFHLVNHVDGQLTLDEFLSGVFKLNDTPKQIDTLVLQHDSKVNTQILGDIQKQLQDLALLSRKMARRTTMIGNKDKSWQPGLSEINPAASGILYTRDNTFKERLHVL